MSDLGIRLAQNVEQEEEEDQWRVFGRRVPKQEAVFFSQVILIYTVVITCIPNLSLTKESNLWTALLSSCLSYILPSPTIKSNTAGNFVERPLHDTWPLPEHPSFTTTTVVVIAADPSEQPHARPTT